MDGVSSASLDNPTLAPAFMYLIMDALADGNIRSVLARAIETTTHVATKLGAAKA